VGRIIWESNYRREWYMPEFKPVKKYGFFSFIGDILMVAITGGLWLIWIFVREMRRR
jgi:hypothetical protein